MNTTKRCTACKDFKLLKEFYDEKGSKDGKMGKCIQCKKEQNAYHKNKFRMEIVRNRPEGKFGSPELDQWLYRVSGYFDTSKMDSWMESRGFKVIQNEVIS